MQTGVDAKYDLAVIGAGSAGFPATITAADQEANVAPIECGTIGGACVNVGCVPSKTHIRAAETLHVSDAASCFDGITSKASVTNWKAVVAQKQSLVDDLRQAKYADLLPAYNSVAYIEGKAKFQSDGTLTVDGKTLNAPKAIIATGTQPSLPTIEGIEDVPYMTSTTALELEELPDTLMVIGAGYIGVEIVHVFAWTGVNVAIVSRRDLLPEAEPEISKALTEYFADEGITIVKGISYERIDDTGDAIVLLVNRNGSPERVAAEKLLIATGRVSNSEDLNLAAAGIDTIRNGGVQVDANICTSREGVYAAGDVTGTDQFVYMAAYGAKIAAKNAMNGNSMVYDNSIMPAVVFTDPQIALVGLTEKPATATGHDVKTSVLTQDNVPRALAARDAHGLIKLIADAKTKKLLGAHILAPEGSDSIQTAAVVLKAGMTYSELGEMIFPYLTTVVGLKLAAQTFDMDVKKLSCCAG